MSPYFVLFGKNIPYYGVLYSAGLLLGGCLGAIRCKKRGIQGIEAVYAACFTGIGGVIGAKILSILTSIKYIIAYSIPFMDIIKNGFVFYGGLLGGMLGLFIYCKAFKTDVLEYYDIFAVSLPIGHAIGRVGCFLSGCCYGMPYDGPLAVTYTVAADPNTPLGVPLLPIQLIEASLLVGLYIVLEVVYHKTEKRGLCTSIYLLSYAAMRFVLEFFRRDVDRGSLFGVSTSQWISMILVVGWTVAYVLYLRKKNSGAIRIIPYDTLSEEGKDQTDMPS